MKKIRRDRGSKYTDEFKRELGTESRVAGISVPVVAKQFSAWAPTGFMRIAVMGGFSLMIPRTLPSHP